MYPPEMVAPMAKELNDKGINSLTTAAQVTEILEEEKGTVLVIINSVCGCAAANARPGAMMSLDNDKKPSKAVTVFAGVDKEATNKAREYMLPYPPSSPAIALFKDGKLAHMLERHHIEGRPADTIADHLKKVYDNFC